MEHASELKWESMCQKYNCQQPLGILIISILIFLFIYNNFNHINSRDDIITVHFTHGVLIIHTKTEQDCIKNTLSLSHTLTNKFLNTSIPYKAEEGTPEK